MAPQTSQDRIKPAMRAAYDEAVAKLPNATQLDARTMVTAFDMWDKLVGAKIKK